MNILLIILGMYLVVGVIMGMCFALEACEMGESTGFIARLSLWNITFGPIILITGCLLATAMLVYDGLFGRRR